jgi:hypothetical protein
VVVAGDPLVCRLTEPVEAAVDAEAGSWRGTVRYGAGSGCLYLVGAGVRWSALVWPPGTTAVMTPGGRRGVRLPLAGTIAEGDTIEVHGVAEGVPYREKLGERYRPFFDRCGLTGALGHLFLVVAEVG